MFTAKLISVTADPQFPGISVSTIQFYKDNKSFGEPDIERGFNGEQLEIYCKEKIEKLEQDEVQENGMAELIFNPPLGVISITPEEIPTPIDQAKEELAESIVNLEQTKRKIELGVIDTDHPDYLSALNDAKDKQAALDELE